MSDQGDVAPQPAPLSLPLGVALPVPLSRAKQGPGSLLAIPSGSLAGDLRGIALDEKRRIATYELLVANETFSPVATFAYVVGATPGGMMSWNTITVPAFTSIALTIDIPLPPRGKDQRVVVELHAEDAHLTLDATTPQSKNKRGLAGNASLAAAAAIVAGAMLYSSARPRILALAAPSSVLAGKPFTVAYALAGNAGGSYIIETPDGFQVRRGTLDHARTALTIKLPEFPIPRGYDMRVTAQGMLGVETRTVHITTIPPAVTPPPQPRPTPNSSAQAGGLPSIMLAGDTVPSGGQIALSYPITGASGTVTLYDQNNTARANALLDKSGHASLLAPVVTADQPFRVVIRMQSGNSTIESAAALTVKAQTLPTSEPETASLSADETGAPFTLSTQSVKSGATIQVPILRHEEALRIGLSTAAGEVLSQENIPLSQSDVTLKAPAVKAPTPYLVVGTYRIGVGQETVVRRILVTP